MNDRHPPAGRRDFGILLVVCVKMLFRRATRTRFACLLGVFLFTMVFNTCTFVTRLHHTEAQRRELLADKACRVFFLRMRTPGDLGRFVDRRGRDLAARGASPVPGAFIYQNNLYLDVPPGGPPGDPGLALLYALFQVRRPLADVFVPGLRPDHLAVFRNGYVDHNGRGLDAALQNGRRHALQRDLIDMTDSLRQGLAGRRLAVYNDLRRRLLDDLRPLATVGERPDPFVSRVGLVVPLTFCHLFHNLRRDNTTDVFDLATTAVLDADGRVEVARSYLRPPAPFAGASLYGERDIYPRYVPVHAPALLQSGWHSLLYRDLTLDRDLLDRLEEAHAGGHYLFSYEKTRVLRERVDRIRRDLYANQVQFYLTDLTLGTAFPFMMSLFAFVHLKAELAFLLMFRNLIRQLLAIFWLLPIGLMLAVKAAVLAGFFVLSAPRGELWAAMALPPAAAFVLTALVFYPINRWCFAPLTGRRLNLYALHRG